MANELGTEQANNTLSNLSKFMGEQERDDKIKLQGRIDRGEYTKVEEARTRSLRSSAAVRALIENHLTEPFLASVLQERITEVYSELEKARQELAKFTPNTPAYFRATEGYNRSLRYYNGLNKNYADFLKLTSGMPPQPGKVAEAVSQKAPPGAAVQEKAAPKMIQLKFGQGEELRPRGSEQSPWASGNARFVEKAIFRAYEGLGVTLPFPPDDIISGMARPADHMPSDIKYEPNKPPLLWMDYTLDEQVNGRWTSVHHAVNSHAELVQLLSNFRRAFPDSDHPGTRIHINMRKDIAEQLIADNLRAHPGILLAIAKDLSRYLPADTTQKLNGVKFTI